MTRSFTSLAVLVVVTLSALAVKEVSAAPSCMDVTGQLIPCLNFLNGYDEDFPSPGCCSGAQNIACQAQTQDDRRAICECLSNALASIGSSSSFGARIPLIATKCGVDVSLPPITGERDYCSKYQTLPLSFIFHS
ncbi:lipid transfer protein 5 [Hibiscus trionum]|uniref:Non-specific lipid-transfer protein n=1 Tax=Hibiscus trionum TaxID=183268 RepID=A0A9W7LSF8_HIBTR|nr:lipid transfer protein 5 [Hibiscus trionum]